MGKQGEGKLGESWEISGVASDVSVVTNGPLSGKSLREMISEYTVDLLGKKVYKKFGATFPLLFKFIDASDDLSVQLHPDDEVAAERHNSFGKTEMWYIVQCDPGSRLILGFNREMDQQSYLTNLESGNITDILNEELVKPGDSFFIAPGTVHAIGAGVLLAEIQQTSDITYRIYDWDRPGLDGKMRELHTVEALDVIDFNNPDAKLQYADKEDEVVEVCHHRFFQTNRLKLTNDFKRDYSSIDSFVVYMCLEGQCDVKVNSEKTHLKKGESILIPAEFDAAEFITVDCELLEIYIP